MDTFYSDMSQGRFERLTKQECIDTFATDFVSGRGTLVVVTNDQSVIGNQSLHWVGMGNDIDSSSVYPGTNIYPGTNLYGWMCFWSRDGTQPCNKTSVQASFHNWSVAIDDWTYPLSEANLQQDLDNGTAWHNATWATRANVSQTGAICASQIYTGKGAIPSNLVPVDHCLSQTIEQDCQLLFSLPICIVIILCNLTKIICMFLTAQDDRKEIFLTVGDAISSFLTRPDPTTEGKCLLSMKNISVGHRPWKNPLSLNKQTTTFKYSPSSRIPDNVLPPRKRWIQAASIWHWFVTIELWVPFETMACISSSQLY